MLPARGKEGVLLRRIRGNAYESETSKKVEEGKALTRRRSLLLKQSASAQGRATDIDVKALHGCMPVSGTGQVHNNSAIAEHTGKSNL